MTIATAGSVFFKLALERGRYRELVGETLDAEDPQMRETLATVLRRSCVEQDADVEVRGRLYHAAVFILSERPELCFLEADRDGVPIGARDTKAGWLDRSALPYLRELAERWSRAESPTHAPGLPLASAFIPPRLRLLTSEQSSRQEPESGWVHWEDLSGHARVVLIGEPGAGKSTCLRRLVHEANLRSDQQVDTLPIYLQLREFTAADLTVEHLRRLLAPQLDLTAPDEFNPPQNGGRILLLLDGLDEIASNDERRALLENIRVLCAQAPSIRIIVTTRGHSYDGELAEFSHLLIEPFTLDRMSHWYLLSTGTAPTDADRARVFAALLRDANLRDLFGNPLMLSVVTAADARNWVTNGEKAPLLRRCVDMLTENWDATRGVTRWDTGTVTPRQMKTSLADLSCTLILQNRADFTIGDFEQLVASNVGIHDSPAELLDACHATGLITAQDRGTYRFTHQALREYLAASRVADHVSVAAPLLRACPADPHAQNVWSLSCATTTDASDLLGTALKLQGPRRLERAAILASALGQQITASRDVINQCSDYIATQLEAELANARIAQVGTEGPSEEDQDHAGPDKAVVWRAALHLPTEGNDAERDEVLEHLLVAVHNTRSGSGAELVKNRLERSSATAVRLLAALQTVEGNCTARVQRYTHTLLISFIVLDPTKLLAAELNAARAAHASLGDPHAFSDDRGSSSLDTTDDSFSKLHETLVTRLGLRAAPVQRPSPMPKDTPAPSPVAVQVASDTHVNLSHSQALRSPPPYRGHAFISYAREDSDEADRLHRALEDAGIRVWRDTANLWPGEDWRAKIRKAITQDALAFIACFSSRSGARQLGHQSEELLLAIERMRSRRPDQPWLIPVRFDDCEIPDLELDPDRSLASLQRADLFGANRDMGTQRLVAAVQQILRQPALSVPSLKTADLLDRIPLALSHPTLRELRSVLCETYFRSADVAALVRDAGGEEASINWDQPIALVWNEVLVSLTEQGKLRLLLQNLIDGADATVAERLRELTAEQWSS